MFNEPTEFFYKKLMAGPEKQAPPHPLQEHFPTYTDTAMLKVLTRAQQLVTNELQDTKDKLLHTDLEIKALRERITEFTKKKKQADKQAAAARGS